MTEYERQKKMLASAVSKASMFNAEAIVEGIEVMIDLRVAELLSQLSDKLEKDK